MPANTDGPEMVSPGPGGFDPGKYSATTWSSRYEELRTPSGQLCLVQRIGISELIEGDMLDDWDLLSNLVEQEHVSKKSRGAGKAPGKKKQASSVAEEILKDKEKLQKTMRLMNHVVIKTVVAPKILPLPDDPADRDPEKIYIDMVLDDDKSFILQYAFGGTRDLERFRSELAEVVDGLGNVKAMENSSK
jgi:hypothetical protein